MKDRPVIVPLVAVAKIASWLWERLKKGVRAVR